ncbi:MAG: TRAP transporter large permease [Planctomycetes bacterium]|nr:TRAP transporter large permease [Planctomycetota bacterium]
MMIACLLLLVSFICMLLMKVPIAVAIAASTVVAILATGEAPDAVVAMKMVNGIDSFALLAIPFFVLSGLLMGRGGMAVRLIDFANALMGRFTGGLGYVNTLTCMLFGSISGSAAAAVSSIGGFIIPEMEKKGYDRSYGVAITTTAATTGLLIPPSNIMIIYAVSAGSVSIAGMFLAGIIPGIVTGLLIMLVGGVLAYIRGYGSGEASSIGEVWYRFRRAVLSLTLVVIVMGGILGGVFTATEAAAIAVAYSLFLAMVVYGEVKVKDLPEILLQSAITTSIVMLLIASSCAMSYFLTIHNVPQVISASLLALSDNPIVIFLVINMLLLLVGTFMDMTPAVLIFTPIFLPVVMELGMHPLHFGIVMIANLCIGLCTPPVGSCLFIGCSVGKVEMSKVAVPMIPFFCAMGVALLLITYVPSLSMILPELMGLVK